MLRLRSILLEWNEVSTRGLITVTAPLPTDPSDAEEVALLHTVLDPRLEDTGGALKLSPGISLFNPDDAKALGFRGDSSGQYTAGWMVSILGENSDEMKGRVLNVEVSDCWVYLPKGTNLRYALQDGMQVLTSVQRSANWLVTMGLLWSQQNRRTGRPNSGAYQQAFSRYLHAIKKDMCYKRGHIDNNASCVKSATARAVAVNNCELPLDTVGIPARVIRGWMRSDAFLDAYNLRDLPYEAAFRYLEASGFRVLLGRQPTHRKTNLFSIKVRILR